METQSTPDPLSKGHFDQNSPVSLYGKMGTRWAKKFMDKLSEIPDCADLITNEIVLKEHLEKNHKFCPTGADNRYRLQLWLEYENSIKMDRPMLMSNVYNLVGPESTFTDLVMKSAPRVVWLLCKPISYEMRMRDMLDTGISRLRGYLEKDAWTSGKNGKPDMQLMKLQLEITKMADLRQHGAPTQKIQSFELKGTIGANGALMDAVDKLDMKTLMERQKKLQDRKRASEGRAAASSIVDVEVVENGEPKDGGSGQDGGASS